MLSGTYEQQTSHESTTAPLRGGEAGPSPQLEKHSPRMLLLPPPSLQALHFLATLTSQPLGTTQGPPSRDSQMFLPPALRAPGNCPSQPGPDGSLHLQKPLIPCLASLHLDSPARSRTVAFSQCPAPSLVLC